MRTRFLQFLLALALCVVMAPVTASAYKGHDKDKDNDRHADRDRERDNDKDRDHRVSHDRDRDGDRDRDRDKHARPAGWSKGRKTGWGNCNLPPGQAKKNGGCNTGRRDRDDRRVAGSHTPVNRGIRPASSATTTRGPDGRLIVRRTAIRQDDQGKK
jgi:hypothetical protein